MMIKQSPGTQLHVNDLQRRLYHKKEKIAIADWGLKVLAQPRVLHISVQTSSVETICQNYLEYLVHPYKEYLQLQHSIKSMFTEKGKANFW